MLFLSLINPVGFEPVVWSVRVTVEPVLRTINRASPGCLVHETFRHQRNFIKKDPSQGNTLNEIL